MRNRPQRWFERLEDGRVAIYDSPTASTSMSVSLVSSADLAYYRANFNLQHIWSPT